jgi:hypothetical protein
VKTASKRIQKRIFKSAKANYDHQTADYLSEAAISNQNLS